MVDVHGHVGGGQHTSRLRRVAAEVRHDLWYSARTLRRAPAFTAVAVLSLGLAIGASTAIFGLMQAVLLDRIAVPNAERLVSIWPERDGQVAPVDYAGFKDLVRTPGISPIEGFRSDQVTMTSRGELGHAWADLVTGGFFDMLRVHAVIGRPISRIDEQNASPVAVLSWNYWQRVLGGDSTVLGRTVTVNDAPFTIVGVMPASYPGVYFGRVFTLAIPITAAATAGLPDVRTVPIASYMARLDAGATIESVSGPLDAAFVHCCANAQVGMANRRDAVSPKSADEAAGFRVRVEDASRGLRWGTDLRGEYRRTLFGLMAGVIVLLLIACTNVGNLLLTRAAARQREFAIRMSLGASRGRLARQLLTESLQLAVGGTMLGLALAWGMTAALSHNLPSAASAMTDLIVLQPNRTLLGFTAATMVIVTLLAGVFPAVRASRAGFVTAANDAGSRIAARGPWALDQALTVAQVALAVVLVCGAILFTATFRNLKERDGGYKTTNVLIASLSGHGTTYADRGVLSSVDPLRERIAGLTGVRSVAIASAAPVLDNSGLITTSIRVGGTASSPADDERVAVNFVTPGYFSVTGTGLQTGRDFTDADGVADAPVAIVSAALARRYFPGRSPIGASIVADGNAAGLELRIVGVANDARYEDLRAPTTETFYVPLAQSGRVGRKTGPTSLILIARTAGDPTGLVPAVHGVITNVLPGIQIPALAGIEHILNDTLARERLSAALALLFGILALGLGAVGLYGVVTYNVERRTREIGIRMALGARPLDALGMVLAQTVAMTAAGLAIGIPLALGASRALRAQLFGIQTTDPRMLIGAAVILLAVGLLASALPAWRAGSVDPVVALRAE
ncbi:MAG TPA: ABC transporter permease [Gemmatimonadaceae bacterium]|jgi:predicted permease